MKRHFWLVIAAIGFLTASSAYAGGPFWVNKVKDLGDAQHWGGNTLEWWIEPEGNDLATGYTNATVKGWIQSAFDNWTTKAQLLDKDKNPVKTVSFTATFGGHTDEGIDETNYETYYNHNPGKIVIVFDKNGMITKDMAGENYLYIPGLTELLLSDEDGKVLLKGIVILNGLLLSGGEISLTMEQFQAAIQHELGHLINLDHTQVNLDVADNCMLTPGLNFDVAGCPDSQFIPTMFPALKTFRQGELKIDDISTISWIYPSAAFGSSFCTITGEIQDMNGRPMQGVNVIAKRVSSSEDFVRGDSRSMVSGVLYTACNNDGHYYLHGIVPGRTYDVIYEPLDSSYTGMSGFEPLGSPPVGFDPGTIGQAKCDNGGETVEMEAVKIDGINFDTYCPPESGDGDVSDSGGKGCSLIIPK